ncbi:unnamed protein product [Amoebophrya sp. A25]|nr:unnamed protein product [Amoebophrya sp. A25]|eukprot:GSA25T00016151001.1
MKSSGSPKRKKKAGGQTETETETETEKHVAEARPTQVVFEILPTVSAFEPTPSESLVRLQQKCDDQQLNLYDMCPGRGAVVGEIDKALDAEVREQLQTYATEQKKIPVWMREINREVGQTMVDYSWTKDKYTREEVFSFAGNPRVTERSDVVIVRPVTLPEVSSHRKVQTPETYQLYNNMSRTALIKDRLEKFGHTFDTTRYDAQRQIRFRTMEERREDFKKREARGDLAHHTKEMTNRMYDVVSGSPSKIQLERHALTTVPFEAAYLDGLVPLRDKIDVAAAGK